MSFTRLLITVLWIKQGPQIPLSNMKEGNSMSISLTNSSHTSLFASEITTKSRDYTLETGCRCHLLTVNSEGRLTNLTRNGPTLENERSTSHIRTDSSIRHRSKSSHQPVWKERGVVVATCHSEHGWDWLVLTEGQILRITGVTYIEVTNIVMWDRWI